MVQPRSVLLCVLLACAGVAPLHAQTSPPQGVLQPPSRTPPKPEAVPTPPKAAPVAPVQRVAPFVDPQTGRAGSSVLARPAAPKPPPVVQPPHRANAVKGPEKPAAKSPAAAKPGAAAAGVVAGAAVGAAAGAGLAAGAGGAAPTPAPADKPAAPERPVRDPTKGSETGLPLPRWASLKAGEVNMRTGPGLRYPTDWVYRRKELPVQIEREFDVWRLVADPDGVKGWVHQQTLTSRRGFILKGPEQTLRGKAADDASPVAILKPGVVGLIRSCAAEASWCDVEVASYKGWVRRDALWGISTGEAITR